MIKEIVLGILIVISTFLIWLIISAFLNLFSMPTIILIITIVLLFTAFAIFLKERKYK